MKTQQLIFGHQPLQTKINVTKELKRLRRDPLGDLIVAMGKTPNFVIQDEISRYLETYYFFYLCIDRFLHEMSIARRWDQSVYYTNKYGDKYTPSQRIIANKYNLIHQFIELDFFTCIIYARMLLDRAISISRHFIKGQTLPSFTSFNDHKKFFLRLKTQYGQFEEYAKYIREETEWFNMPLKIVRDKFIVHQGPQHIRNIGSAGFGPELFIMIPDEEAGSKDFSRVKPILLNIPQLAHDVHSFLTWFNKYGLSSLKKTN
jgi:hypothetical protein